MGVVAERDFGRGPTSVGAAWPVTHRHLTDIPLQTRGRPRLCANCGGRLHQIGRLCVKCATIRNAERKMRSPKFPARSRLPEPNPYLGHLVWIRSLPCAVKGCFCRDIEAHHVRVESGGGMGKKPGPEWTVPLCGLHHREGHQNGWKTFETKHSIDLRALAIKLAAAHLEIPF